MARFTANTLLTKYCSYLKKNKTELAYQQLLGQMELPLTHQLAWVAKKEFNRGVFLNYGKERRYDMVFYDSKKVSLIPVSEKSKTKWLDVENADEVFEVKYLTNLYGLASFSRKSYNGDILKDLSKQLIFKKPDYVHQIGISKKLHQRGPRGLLLVSYVTSNSYTNLKPKETYLREIKSQLNSNNLHLIDTKTKGFQVAYGDEKTILGKDTYHCSLYVAGVFRAD